MPTPLFKVLANSIRLGQPPDPVTAIKALVEVIAHQEGELNDLRQRISLLNSRLQFLEAKTSRMEVASFQSGPPPSSVAPFPADPIVMPQPQPAHAGLAVPSYLPKADPLPSRVERSRSQLPPPFSPSENEDSQDEAGGTLVVARADIDAVVKLVVENEAPFPLPPPGGHRPPEHLADMPFKPAALAAEPAVARRRPPAEGVPDPRGSISDPYVPIEDLGSEDTFSSTAEVAAAPMPAPAQPPAAAPARRVPVLDEATFGDEMLTSIHKRGS